MTQNIAFDSPCFLFGHPTVRDNSLPWLRDGPQRGQNHRDQHLTTEKHPQNCRIGCSWPLPRHQSSASSSLSSPASASSRTHDHAMLIPRTNASGTRTSPSTWSRRQRTIYGQLPQQAPSCTQKGESNPYFKKTRSHTSYVAWYVGHQFRLIVCLHTDSFHSSILVSVWNLLNTILKKS